VPNIVHQTLGDRSSWLAARRALGVGASELAAAMGKSPFQSRLGLYESKIREEETEKEEPTFLRMGRRFEAAIADETAYKLGLEVEDPGDYSIWSRGLRFATPDRLVLSNGRPSGVLEIKSTEFFHKHLWDEGPPFHVRAQAQQQMYCTGLTQQPAIIAACWSMQRVDTYEEPYSEEFASLADAYVDSFWLYVSSRTPPAVDPEAPEQDARAIKALWPKNTGETIALSEAAAEAHTELAALKGWIKTAQKRETYLKNIVRAEMGENTFGEFADGGYYTHKAIVYAEKMKLQKARVTRTLLYHPPKETKK